MVKLVIQISKGLIRDQVARRQIMFYGLLAALVMLFLGSTLLYGWLREHPVLFLVYWAICAWITLMAMLLAVFDMLIIRTTVRRTQRRLESEYLKKADKVEPDDS